LAAGFGGTQGPAEGPLWWKEGKYLLFSDIHNNKRMKYEPGKGVSVFLEPTNRANGLTRDLQGRLLACEHDSRRITRLELDGSLTVLASSFQGRQLNRPNDVVVKSDGAIYFTDPWTNPALPNQWDLTFSGVYRLTPDLGTMTLLVEDFVIPNGLAFSPDEKILYINDSRRRLIRAFDLNANGSLARQSDRVFADLGGPEPGVPDGMKVDTEGAPAAGAVTPLRASRGSLLPHRGFLWWCSLLPGSSFRNRWIESIFDGLACVEPHCLAGCDLDGLLSFPANTEADAFRPRSRYHRSAELPGRGGATRRARGRSLLLLGGEAARSEPPVQLRPV
jgi:gluconolactonase